MCAESDGHRGGPGWGGDTKAGYFDIRQEADSPFGFAQGRLFGNDNKKSNGKAKSEETQC
jgi:hypothetical protein